MKKITKTLNHWKVPSRQSTARWIFHKIQFHQVFIRRDVSEMENFPRCDCVSARKIHHAHTRSGFKEMRLELLAFFQWITLWTVSKCGVFLHVVVLGFSTRRFYSERNSDEENLFPSFWLPWNFTVSWNDINSCRKGDSSFRRKCTLSVKSRGLKSKIMSQWMRRCRLLSLAFVLMSSSRW